MTTLRVGVLADTHIPYRLPRLPEQVFAIFDQVDLILHAGDLDEEEVLAELSYIAPTLAVRGNPHLRYGTLGSPHLPKAIHLNLYGHSLVLVHGRPRLALGFLDKVRAFLFRRTNEDLNRDLIAGYQRAFPTADVVVFGHSHRACAQRVSRTLFFNPGAVCRTRLEPNPSVGLLTIGPTGIEADIIPLAEP
ncbi:MAG: metallophosphoesterase [Anaerolineales bacterium]|nr:MAG: metallophosphoesterase [Anaerolineales bacterium]